MAIALLITFLFITFVYLVFFRFKWLKFNAAGRICRSFNIRSNLFRICRNRLWSLPNCIRTATE